MGGGEGWASGNNFLTLFFFLVDFQRIKKKFVGEYIFWKNNNKREARIANYSRSYLAEEMCEFQIMSPRFRTLQWLEWSSASWEHHVLTPSGLSGSISGLLLWDLHPLHPFPHEAGKHCHDHFGVHFNQVFWEGIHPCSDFSGHRDGILCIVEFLFIIQVFCL